MSRSARVAHLQRCEYNEEHKETVGKTVPTKVSGEMVQPDRKKKRIEIDGTLAFVRAVATMQTEVEELKPDESLLREALDFASLQPKTSHQWAPGAVQRAIDDASWSVVEDL